MDRRQGLIFGMFGGLAYTLAVFGYDAVLLAQASADHYWWKLALGLILFMAIGGAAGWLTAASDSSLVGLIAWIAAGVAFGWLTGHLSFEGYSRLVSLLEPGLRGLELYPISQAAQIRTALVVVALGIAGGLAGILQLTFQEMAQNATSIFGRILATLIWSMIFIVPALGIDIEVNVPARRPFQVTDQLILLARQAETTTIDPQLALDKHLGAIGSVEHLVSRPYRLVLGGYDTFSMTSVNVVVDFSGEWAQCVIVSAQPGYCQKVEEVYQKALTCLLETPNLEGGACNLEVESSARGWLQEERENIEPSPPMQVTSVRGAVTLVDLTAADGQTYHCRFQGIRPIVMLGCEVTES